MIRNTVKSVHDSFGRLTYRERFGAFPVMVGPRRHR